MSTIGLICRCVLLCDVEDRCRLLNNLFSFFGFPAYVHSDRGSSFISTDLKAFFAEWGIPFSRSTPYHPTGNSQCERTNKLDCMENYQTVIASPRMARGEVARRSSRSSHAMRSLLCTATNETQHERIFRFQRRVTFGTAMATWLLAEGPLLLRRHVRNKGDPLCDEVLLLEARQHTVATDEKICRCVRSRSLSKLGDWVIHFCQVIATVEAEVTTNIPDEEPSGDADEHKSTKDVKPRSCSTSDEISPSTIPRRYGRKGNLIDV